MRKKTDFRKNLLVISFMCVSFSFRIKELEIEVCKLKCEVISLIQGSIKIPLKGQFSIIIIRSLLMLLAVGFLIA